MESYEILSDDIVCIDTAQHRPRMAACYLIGSDGHYAFVESGTSLSVPLLLERWPYSVCRARRWIT